MKRLLLFIIAMYLFLGSSLAQITIGTGTSTQRQPFGCYWGYERSASIYTSSEIGVNGTITTLGWYVNDVASTNIPTKIYLKTTTSSTLTSSTWASMISGATLVYDATRNYTPTGWLTIDITDYTYPGDNLLVLCETNYGGGGSTTPYFRYSTATNKHQYWGADNNPPLGSGTVNSNRPNIQLNITTSACSGTPDPGNTISSANPVCPGVNFTLSLQNVIPGTGVTYLWQSSTTGGAPWANLGTASTQVTSQTVSTYYRCQVTCGANTGTSVPLQVTMNSLFNCYCASGASSAGDEDITLVQFGSTLNNSSACASLTGSQGTATGTADLYSNFTSITPTDIIKGQSVPISVQITECAGTAYGHDVRVYIDFNQNGLLTDAGEEFIIWPYASSNTHTINVNIDVPAGAASGNTLMRVVCKESSTTGPCLVSSYGETEDYLVNILEPSTSQLTWYNLQFPGTANKTTSQNVSIYGQCWESGITEAAGPGTGIEAWIGYSTTNATNVTDFASGWTWVPATYNYGVDPNNNDEYQADLGVAQALDAGTYYYVSRFRYNNGPFTYGGFNGGPWNGTSNVSGVLTITCPRPTAQTATTITSSGANLGWTDASGTHWDLYIVSTGSPAPNAGSTPTVNDTQNKPHTWSSGNPETTYDWYVRADCGQNNTDVSNWRGPHTFTTLFDCVAGTVLNCNTPVTSGNLAVSGGIWDPIVTSCGWSTPGKEKVYRFTPAVTGLYQLQITNVNGGFGYIDYFYKAASGGCSSTGWTCIDDLGSGTTVTFGPLIAGTEYYILLDAESAASTANHTFQINCPVDMSFVSTTVGAQTTTNVGAGSVDASIVRLDVVVTGSSNPLSATSFTCSTNGSTAPVTNNVTTGKVYYTGISSTYSTSTLVGSVAIMADGSFTITGNQLLTGGFGNITNYFWLAYDIACGAIGSQVVDGEFNSVTIGTPRVPTPESLTGNRTITALTAFETKADGNWSNANTWACGVPPSGTTVPIIINHVVSLNVDYSFDANLTIAAGKTLNIAGNTLTVGPSGGGNRVVTVNGTLDVSGGTLNINGNVIIASGSTFNQSGGNINIDGNGTTSVASGTVLWSQNSASGTVNGGQITIIDPPATGSARSFVYSVGTTTASWAGHTLAFGDGISAASSTNVNGFEFDTYVSTGELLLGNLVVNGGSGPNRWVTTSSSSANGSDVGGDVTINENSELRNISGGTGLLVGGNIINNGTLTTNVAVYLGTLSGTAFIPSPVAQSILGSGVFRNTTTSPTASMANLQVYNGNASGVTLNVPISVSASLTLTGGRINTTAVNYLQLGTSGTLLGTLYTNLATTPTNIENANVGGWVNGPFKRWFSGTTVDVSQQGILPIGNSTVPQYAQVVFTTTPGSGTLTSFFTDGAPGNTGLPLTDTGTDPYCNPGAVSGTGFVTINPDGLGTGTYTSRFNVTNYSGITTLATARVLKRPSGGGNWTLDGTYVAGANNLISRTGMSGFSEFAAVQGSNISLPLELLSFKGYADKSVNVLEWTTAREVNADIFIIERSENGKNWEDVAEVDAKGFSINTNGYKATDDQPLSKAYYRLKSIDRDGRFQVSDAIIIERNDRSFKLYSVSPNPNRGDFTVTFNAPSNGENKMILVNSLGMKVHSQVVNAKAGTNAEYLNATGLANGIYTLLIEQDGQIITQRVVINK